MALVPIDTARLRLRPLVPSDVDAVLAILGHEQTTASVSFGQSTREDAAAYVDRRCRNEVEHGYSMWGVETLAHGDLIGLCGFFPTTDAEKVELGYVIHADHWGQGLATEAASAAVGIILASGRRVVATIRPTNHASIGVASKTGLTHGSETRDEKGPLHVFTAG